MASHIDLHQMVYDSILIRIFSKKYQIGHLLPSSQQMAAEFGVSLNTVRLAYQQLQQEGYIQSTRKKGTQIIFDVSAPSVRDLALRYTLERENSILDVSWTMCYLIPPLAAYGASLLDENGLAGLGQFQGAFQPHSMNPLEIAVFIGQLFRFLLIPVKNPLFLDFFDSATLFARLPHALSGEEKNMFSEYLSAETGTCVYSLLRQVEEKNPFAIRRSITALLKINYNAVRSYLSQLSSPESILPQVPFRWSADRYFHQTFSAIAFDLLEQICTGVYLVGDYLPSESELKQKYAVSTNTIRCALSMLDQTGLIQKRQGKGSLVTADREIFDSFSTRPGFFQSMDPFCQCLQIVLLTSKMIADEAAEKIPREALNNLRKKNQLLINQPQGFYYSPYGALATLVSSVLPSETMRSFYRQLEAAIFLRGLKYPKGPPCKPEVILLFECVERFAQQAADCLWHGETDAFTANFHNIWVALAEIILKSNEQSCFASCLPFPIKYLDPNVNSS